MSILIQEVLSGTWYIDREGFYQPYESDSYSWESYINRGEEWVSQLVKELKDNGLEVPIVYHRWSLKDGEWHLDVVKLDEEPFSNTDTVVVKGTPGTKPTDKDKEAVIKEVEAREEQWKVIVAKREAEEERTQKASLSLVGGVVEYYEAPEKDEEGVVYGGVLRVRTTEGILVQVCSTHTTWDYGESSADSLYISVVDEEAE